MQPEADVAAEQPEERTCPSRGASSPPNSSYCWQCFKPFATTPLTPPSMPSGHGLPEFSQPQPLPTGTAPKRKRSVTVRIVAGVVAALIAAAIGGAFSKKNFSFPEQIAGTPRMHTAEAQQFETQVDEWGKASDNLPLKGAAYGTGAQADFLVGAAPGSVKNSVDEIEQVVHQSVTGSALSPDSVTVSGSRDGVEYRCADANGEGSICVWRESNSSGFVVALGRDPNATLDLLFTVRQAID